jgi:hypothetical protein
MSAKMCRIAVAVPLMLLLGVASLHGQVIVPNPVPQIAQPLVPMSAAPGGDNFALTVNGTGFVSTSQVNWNGSPRATTFVNSTQLTAAIDVVDVAAAGTALVTVVNPTPGGGTSNVAFFHIIAPFSPVAFGRAGYVAGSNPISVITADFNADGALDLGVVNPLGTPISIFLGNGDGTFQDKVDYSTGTTGSYSVVAGDFNGDGNLDLAATNPAVVAVSILTGNGDGTFQAAANYSTGNGPYSVATGDLNGDGTLDLVTSNDIDNTVSVLLGNGDGTFQTNVDYATGALPLAVIVADLDGDGILDLATANAGNVANSVSVLLGNGDGTFQAKADYATGSTPYSVTATDFNGDGNLDLATANAGTNNASVLLGNGDGTFATGVNLSVGSYPKSVATGDFNGDGVVDLMTADYSSDTVTIHAGVGNGTFLPRVLFSTGDGPNSIVAGDFNGDGMLDVAIVDQGDTVSVLLQGPVARVSLTSLAFGDQIISTPSTSKPVTLTNTGNKPLSISLDTMAFTGANSADFSQTNDCPDAALAQTLAVDASCTINVTFTPSALGTRTAALSIPDDAPDTPQTVDLTGRGVSAGGVGLTVGGVAATGLVFPNQVYNTASDPQTITLTNTGAGTMGISSITTSTGDYAATQCPASLDSGQTCDIQVTFTPSIRGFIAGTLYINDDAAGNPHTASLSGTGIAAVVQFSTTYLQFSERAVGTTSPAQSVTLTNIGDVALNFAQPIAITGDFAQTNTCGSSLAVNASCTFQVTFTPTAVSGRSGQLTITDDAPGSPHAISLSGTGYVTRLSPEEINFDEQAVGSTSEARNLTLSNTGPTAITINSIDVLGTFSQTNTCGTSLAAGSRCTISVSFAPTAAGYESGDVTVDSTAPDGSLSVSVYGTGVVLGVSPRSLSFPGQPVGVTSAPRTVTLTNTGQVATGSLSIAASAAFAQTNNCGTSLAAGASCTIQVTFTPTSAGTTYGSLTIDSDSADGTRYVDLNGVGVVLTASPRPVLFAVRDVDTTSAPQTVTLTNTGQTDISFSGAPAATGDFAVSTNNCGASLAAGASCTVDVTFTPTAVEPRTGYLNVSSTAPEGTLKVLLIGASGIRNLAGFASNVLPANDDGSTQLIPMGFTINYFGNQYGALYVNNNGDVTFDTQLGTFTPFDLTSTGQVIMAPFFGDVDTGGSGSGVVTYGRDTVNGHPAFGVNWFDVGYFSGGTDKLNVFQLVIIDRSDIAPGDFEFEFNYAKVQWETGGASGGTGGLGGFSARAGFSNGSGDPDTFLEIPGSAINGAFLDSNNDTGLIHNSFNSTQFGRYLFNGRGGGVEPPGLHLSPASLTLPGTPLDMICPTRIVTASNTGGTPIAISNVTTNTTEFVATNECPTSLIPGATCTISVEFHPAALGVRQGTLTVESDDPRGPQTAAVSGEGLPACNLSASRRSAVVVRGTEATSFDISDANPSCSPEPIELSCAENDPASCEFSPAVIPPSGRSSLRVGNLVALRSAALNFVVNSRSEFRTASIGLSVLVKDFAFTTAPDVATVEAGGTASYSLSIRPVNGLAGTVALACSGAPRGATCTVTPSQVTLDGASLEQVRVNVRTTARAVGAPSVGPRMPPPGSNPIAPWTAVLAMLLLAVAAASRRRRLALALAMFSVLVWAACGGGGMVSTGGAGGTPPGTSSLTITGTYTTTPAETAAGAPSQVTGTTSLTLTVR